MSYAKGRQSSYGAIVGGVVVDLPQTAADKNIILPQTLIELIEAGEDAWKKVLDLLSAAPQRHLVAIEHCELLAPIPRPKKNIFCVGRNYADHVAEGYRSAGKDVELPKAPQFFTKAPTSVLAPDGEFQLDSRVTRQLDYESELAVVIGKAGKDIAREGAMAHIFGLTIMNDLTARDLQRLHDRWFKGKSLDGSAPLGPAIVTLDEIPDLGALEVTARVNGELRQSARVAQMIFDIPEIIAQLSAGMTLEPGDIIATGTPSGVGYAMTPPQYLTDGDVVECAIDGLGSLRTVIREVGAGQ